MQHSKPAIKQTLLTCNIIYNNVKSKGTNFPITAPNLIALPVVIG